jgi:putative protease
MTTALPELLSPAGTWDALKAAVANGADAVYFGVDALNARMRAANFQRQELPELMQWLHRRGVKGFLTLNVLVFPGELDEAADLVLAAAAAGVDALIVQDIGLARLARELAPNLAIHGSTQMSITSAAGVAQAADLGCQRVVLARELALKDFQRLQGQLQQRAIAMPLEVFVHGALCVAYSGQCLTSEALGQRSANRGECAQACRLPYELIVDGVEKPLGDQRYLLSPQDLAAWELIPQLAELGIASLKIEGRLKEATYVAAVTETYRRSLDQLHPGLGNDNPGPGPLDQIQLDQPQPDQMQPDQTRRNLELSFSRGLSTGWLGGVNHRSLVHGLWSKKRGPKIGQFLSIDAKGWWLLSTTTGLKPGDGLVFEARSQSALEPPPELGGRVMAVEQRPAGCLAIKLGPGVIDGRALVEGAPCWLTSDPALERSWKRMASLDTPERKQALHLRVSGANGEPLVLRLLRAGSFEAPSTEPWQWPSLTPLQPATGQSLNQDRLEAQFGRLGGTPWELGSLEVHLSGELFLPVAQLNQLRRQLVDHLASSLDLASCPPSCPPTTAHPVLDREAAKTALPQILRSLHPQEPGPTTRSQQEGHGGTEVVVLVRSLDQLKALRDQPVHRVIAELEQPHELKEAIAIGRGVWPGGIWLAGARITRPDERWTLDPLIRAQADGYLVRNADQLELLTPLAPCVGDFSLNVANPLTAAWYLNHWGLERITASYDLALDQLLELLAGCPAGSVEVTVHQHMPLFHMEHCLFCAFLSDGHDHTDCGRPCETHTVLLRDRSGSEHPLRADLGCRNTLFNGKAQTAAEALPQLLRSGVRSLRLELLDESADQTVHRVRQYGAAIRGEISGRQLWQQEQLDSRLGVTRGSLKTRRGVR